MKLADLKNAYPPIPQQCHDALVKAAGSIAENLVCRRRWSFAVAIVLCLLLVIAGAAVAARQLGILNFGNMQDASYSFTLPEAETLVEVDLAEKTLDGVTIKIKEAYFDGRVLEILLSLSSLKQGSSNGTYKDAYEGSNWLLDSAWNSLQVSHGYININGQQVNIRSSGFQPGDTPGEYQYLVDSDLEYEVGTTGEMKVLRPKETMEISIHVGGYPKEEAISFTLTVPEEDKWSLPLPPPVQLNGCTMTFTDLHFSPINVAYEYTVLVPAELVPEGSVDLMEEAFFELLERFICGTMVNEKGENLGRGKDGGIREFRLLDNGNVLISYYQEDEPSDKYTETIYLQVEGVMVPILMDSLVK